MIIVKGRELLIPENERYIGTTYDDNSTVRTFRVSRFHEDGMDKSQLDFYVIINYDDGSDPDAVGVVKSVNDDYIVLEWDVGEDVTEHSGCLYLWVRGFDYTGAVRWSSFPGVFYIEGSGTEPSDLSDLEQRISEEDKLIRLAKLYKSQPMTAATAAEMVNREQIYVYVGSEAGYVYGDWYFWNGTAWVPGGVYNSIAIQTDTDLIAPGVAADAKAVGDQKIQRHDTVAQMKANVCLAPGMYAMTGGYRSVNDFGRAFYRINGTAPSTHYETLSNGNFAELVTDGNVTPEMFGAVGDGVADDTAAIRAALTSGCAVVFGQYRTYKVTQDITFHTSLDLNFSTIYLAGCSLIVDDGQSTQQHYDFGIIIENGFFVGDNTNTLLEVKHATKTTIENCAFKDFLTGILVTTGYEHKINGCRFIGNASVHATAIEKNDGDGFVIDVTGVDCYKAIVIQKAKHYINNIHFWILTPSLVDGSVMITYTGAGQSNLVIDYAYFDSYETGIYKSGLATLVLNSSNIVMPLSLWNGEYYLFEFGDANQNFLVTVNDFATPWSNEENFRISTANQSAIFYFNLTKASYKIINIVKDYINNQFTFINGITATGVDVTFDKNLMRFKAILTMPSTLPSGGTKCLNLSGISFPNQSIKLFDGQYGTEYLSFDWNDVYIRNAAGETIDVDVVVKYFPQYT